MSKGAAAVVETLRGVLIPTARATLLLPNAAMHEVIDYRDATPLAQPGPRWTLGTVLWRQRPMPVVSIEQMVGDRFDDQRPRLRIAVCHGQRTDGTLPFIGIVSQGIPRLVRVTESVITADPYPPLPADWPVLARVNLGGERALIPDLDRIATELRKSLL